MPDDPTGRIHRHLRRSLDRWQEDLRGGLVVAVSGGGDSVAMLRALHAVGPELGLALTVAHLDHGARPESAEEARFVADLAGSLGLPFELGRWSPERPGHFEAEARKARYAWLEEVARRVEASAVAVGHTRDDQAETILHRIVRGTGLRGLAGMPARRRLSESVALIRPLLACTRDDLRAYLAALGQGCREDATNADTARTRARIRHDLLPKLAGEYNPRVAEALVRLGRLAGSAQWHLERDLKRFAATGVVEIGEGGVTIRLEPLRHLPTAVRAEVIRRAWREAGWPERAMTARRWRRLARLVDRPPGRFAVGGGIEARLSHGLLRLAPIRRDDAERPRPVPISLSVPGEATWGGGRLVATLDADAACDERIDLDAIHLLDAPEGQPGRLLVRSPRVGDRFSPLGMGGKSMPLNNFFRGVSVERRQRAAVALVCDRAGIVWVVGYRIADRVKTSGVTRRTLGLRWEPGDGCD